MTTPESMSGSGYLKFRNDRGVPEICIGVREFECIGVSPPQDHPHIYIDNGWGGHDPLSLLRHAVPFRSSIGTAQCDPPDSFFADHNAACAEPRRRTGPIAFTRFGRISPRFQWYPGNQAAR